MQEPCSPFLVTTLEFTLLLYVTLYSIRGICETSELLPPLVFLETVRVPYSETSTTFPDFYIEGSLDST